MKNAFLDEVIYIIHCEMPEYTKMGITAYHPSCVHRPSDWCVQAGEVGLGVGGRQRPSTVWDRLFCNHLNWRNDLRWGVCNVFCQSDHAVLTTQIRRSLNDAARHRAAFKQPFKRHHPTSTAVRATGLLSYGVHHHQTGPSLV